MPRRPAAPPCELEPFHRPRNQFAIEAVADEDGDIQLAKAVRARQQRAVPEGEYRGAGDLVARGDARLGQIDVAQGEPEQANQERCERGDESQG
jgi:hypothetical protein